MSRAPGHAGDGGSAALRPAGAPVVYVDDALGDMRPRRYAFGIVGLCTLVAMAEGYDAQAMAFAAPLVARHWGLASNAIGALLGASIIAMVVASFVLAPLGDRLGRRPAILAALLLVAGATGAGAFAPSFGWLLCSRVAAGIGLGLAFPTVIALAMEVMPRRLHTMTVVLVSCGYPIGGAVGGGIAAMLIEQHGAQAIFLLGGGTTATLLLLCLAVLPESPIWLAAKGGDQARIGKLVVRLGGVVPAAAAAFDIREARVRRSPVAALFTPARRSRTLLLWLLNFANLSMVYFYIIWLPSILVNAGHAASFAATALALYSGAGVFGGLGLAVALRRWGTGWTLGGAYLGAGILIGALAIVSHDGANFLPILALSGALIVGSQFCLNAVVNQYYPSAIRTTASGFAGGAGRLGAVAAPLIGAMIVKPENPYPLVIAVGIVPAAIALATLLVLVFAAPLLAADEPADEPVAEPLLAAAEPAGVA